MTTLPHEALRLGVPGVTRRRFLHAGALSLVAVALGPRLALAAATEPRRLRMLNTHTLERVDLTYFDGSAVIQGALDGFNRLLRDHRSGDVFPIDPGALDIAWSLARAIGKAEGEYEIISGYRSPATNARLRAAGRGVASRSLHCVGQAIDLRMPGVPTATLRDAALELARGGVGYYAKSDFVHVDTGRVRRW